MVKKEKDYLKVNNIKTKNFETKWIKRFLNIKDKKEGKYKYIVFIRKYGQWEVFADNINQLKNKLIEIDYELNKKKIK